MRILPQHRFTVRENGVYAVPGHFFGRLAPIELTFEKGIKFDIEILVHTEIRAKRNFLIYDSDSSLDCLSRVKAVKTYFFAVENQFADPV